MHDNVFAHKWQPTRYLCRLRPTQDDQCKRYLSLNASIIFGDDFYSFTNFVFLEHQNVGIH